MIIEGIVDGKLPWEAENRGVAFKSLSYADVFKFPRPEGYVLEFGVSGGGTLRKFSKLIHPHKIYGFDCFTGLPEDWGTYKKGALAASPNQIWPENSEIVIGLFQDTLVDWLEKHPGTISYAHLDADIYSATKYVLEKIKERLVPGSLLHFDEIKIFQCCDHEMRAFEEFMAATNTRWEILGQVTPHDGIFRLLGN